LNKITLSGTNQARSRQGNGIAREFIGFGLVGIAGFSVDSLIVESAVKGLAWNPIVAQIPVFATAVTVTGILNRIYTFQLAIKPSGVVAEWGRYVVANGLGTIVNNGLYITLVSTVTVCVNDPVNPRLSDTKTRIVVTAPHSPSLRRRSAIARLRVAWW